MDLDLWEDITDVSPWRACFMLMRRLVHIENLYFRRYHYVYWEHFKREVEDFTSDVWTIEVQHDFLSHEPMFIYIYEQHELWIDFVHGRHR